MLSKLPFLLFNTPVCVSSDGCVSYVQPCQVQDRRGGLLATGEGQQPNPGTPVDEAG